MRLLWGYQPWDALFGIFENKGPDWDFFFLLITMGLLRNFT